ncbi:hypothetical protein J0383_07895 [Flavobacterium endoglycinae]|uniref:Type II toxin-antitoxin system RelE/ParE family toxin n=1 Tax=Flavobacterium endoglycinae TaxID=2816357 RepID=A0ABX7QJF5_9FLAO|nr:hypothetical protein [Flavobacterium endoglycinae]QSW90721.1 hypothetical protein J0383_07895 [Flavobacterium endoglycinae]
MAKQFVKITKTYSAKNRLCTAILESMDSIDHSLFSNKEYAVKDIKRRYDEALDNYKGKATVPKLQNHQANKKEILYYVEDVIHISIYNVEWQDI